MDACAIDTSTLSDVLRPANRRSSVVTAHSRQYLRAHSHLSFSELSCYEVIRGFRKSNATAQLSRFEAFCQHAELLPVTYEILDRAASLWADGRRAGIVVGDMDLIIAATALIHGRMLVTANPKHFAWIEGLPIVNWREPAIER